MVDAAGVKGFFDSAISASQSLVGLTGTLGIAGFVFDIADESAVELSSEITDHYLENGTPVQDHIVLKPETVTLRGYVGEWHRITTGKKSTLQKAAEKLVTISSYLPAVSNFAQSAMRTFENTNWGLNFDSAFALGDLGVDAYNMYSDINLPSDNQSKAFMFFEALWQARKTFTIETPYRTYTNMAITTLKAIQSGATKDETNFEVSFKKIRYINTQFTDVSAKQGKLKGMASDFLNKGTSVCSQIGGGVKSVWGKLAG